MTHCCSTPAAPSRFRRWLKAAGLLLAFGPCHAFGAQTLDPADWLLVVAEARDQPLFFYAWGGDQLTNDYLAWVGRRVAAEYGIRLTHVRLSDTADAVSRILAEKQAGNTERGAVDMLWINGDNFASLKTNDLLFGPWAEQLPNFAWVNADANPGVRFDFTLPVEGYESPWLRAHLVFYYDSAYTSEPPANVAALLSWTQENPGEFTYPRPPDFLGATFLKQALLELVADSAPLYLPVQETSFATITAPLWQYLDALHPLLLRQGRSFPANGPELRRLMADGEIALALSFNPAEAVNSVLRNELPDSVRTYVPDRGTLANVSFVAIPVNASHKAAAMVTANFLLSPEAQLRAQNPQYPVGMPVIDLSMLTAQEQAQFVASRQSHPSAPPLISAGQQLQEPHPSWVEALEQAWIARYGNR